MRKFYFSSSNLYSGYNNDSAKLQVVFKMSKKYALVLWTEEYSFGVMPVSAASAAVDELYPGFQTKMRWTRGRKKMYDVEILKISGVFIVSYLILYLLN